MAEPESKQSKSDSDGMLKDERVINDRYSKIEHDVRTLDSIKAIVVHQTDSSTAESSLNSYKSSSVGAHFLISKEGQIYQTASLLNVCYHVGKNIKSKCHDVLGKDCDDKDIKGALKMKGWHTQIKKINEIERNKDYPDRYPINADSIGIELVGMHVNDTKYEEPTEPQQESLKWLVGELIDILSIDKSNVYRHPDVSYKNPGEAKDAKWE